MIPFIEQFVILPVIYYIIDNGGRKIRLCVLDWMAAKYRVEL